MQPLTTKSWRPGIDFETIFSEEQNVIIKHSPAFSVRDHYRLLSRLPFTKNLYRAGSRLLNILNENRRVRHYNSKKHDGTVSERYGCWQQVTKFDSRSLTKGESLQSLLYCRLYLYLRCTFRFLLSIILIRKLCCAIGFLLHSLVRYRKLIAAFY